MNLKFLYIILFSLVSLNKRVYSQAILYQDNCNCGVTGAGFSTGLGLGSGNFDIHIEPGSTIKKAFLFTYSAVNPDYNIPIILNNDSIYFKSSDAIMDVQHKNNYVSPVKLYYKDVTNIITATTQHYTVRIQQSGSHINEGLWTIYLYVVYKKTGFSNTSQSIIINEQDLMGNEYYSVNNLNPIFTNYPVGFALYADRVGGSIDPSTKYNVHFNSFLVGTVNGNDQTNSTYPASGVKGHFYYQNNQLFGLDDDTPDSIMGGTDGLADVSSLLANNGTSCDFQLSHINYPHQNEISTSANLAYFLTYTTPCAIIPAVVSSDTSICQGQTVQLHASGGTKYEWRCLTDTLPYGNSVYGLSCKTCANPVFSGDSSAVYTVRVWNGDSCSVVRPVKVTVKNPPTLNGQAMDAGCGFNDGQIYLHNLTNDVDSLYVVSPQSDTLVTSSTASILNLFAGNYTLFYYDTVGCRSSDTMLTIGSYNNTVSDFEIDPTFGYSPLNIHITNTSQNTQNYQWSINGQIVSNPPTHFDTSGTYIVQLVAWNQHPECADTMTKTVLVFDSLIVQIPNVFSPNNDGVNDIFAIQTNLPVRIKAVILNRWGNEVFNCDKNLIVGNNDVWNGETKTHETVVDGTYFYHITFQLDDKVVDCNLQPCEVKKEGFVTVVR